MRTFWRAAIMLLGAGLGSQAAAQDIGHGEYIARTWCANCHAVGAQAPTSARDSVPAFIAVAKMKTTTASSLAAFLMTPHPNMPNFALSRQEIRDVSAYILSLKH